MAANVYAGLVHYPIYNKHEQVVATAITNFDIHDLARTTRTYGIQTYFLIHPHQAQADLAGEIMEHWQSGGGAAYNPDRQEAFKVVEVTESIATAIAQIEQREGRRPLVVTTDARIFPNTVSYAKLRHSIECGDQPVLLLFGTGWGIEKETMAAFDCILEPIYGPSDYNHLPVRAAVAIILDRLLGEPWWSKE